MGVNKEVDELSVLTSVEENDKFVVYDLSSDTVKAITRANLRADLEVENRWTEISTDNYTATPTNTYTLGMSDTTGMVVGLPLKYVISTTTYYGIIVAVSANTSITVAGASLSADVTALYVGTSEMVHAEWFTIASTFADAPADLLAADEKKSFLWQKREAFLVRMLFKCETDDTVSDPKCNVKVNGNAVSSNDSNNGFAVTSAWTAPATTELVAINTSNYDIQFGEAVEIACTAAGGGADAADLSVMTVWVLP